MRGASAELPILELQGFVFLGWYGDYDNITENMVLQPLWTVDVGDTYYTVTFNLRGGDWDGRVSLIQRVLPGSSAIAPTIFRGAYPATWNVLYVNNIQSDLTIDATYQDDSYSPGTNYLVYLDDDGSVISLRYHSSGQLLTDAWIPKVDLPVGYEFTWKIKNEDDSLSDITADMVIEENMTLQAIYAPVKLFVVIYDYDGRILSTQCVDYGDEYTFTEYGQALSGFNRFKYYRYGIDTEYLPGDTIEVTRNITVTALITSFTGYTVTLKANDTVIDVVYAEADEEFVLPQCSVQVTGKSFTAWSVFGATPAVQYLPGDTVTIDKNYIFAAVYTSDDSVFFVKEIKATISSTNSADVVWSVSWLSNSTRKNEDISKYITIIPNADRLKAIIVCLKPFAGDTIIITVTTKDGKYSAQCFITYAVTGVK